jgi:hypothetical protein
MQNWLKLGDYNVICDSCGRKFKASTMRKSWTGLLVCADDYEPKHPQLSLKVHGDKQTVPIPRPDATVDTFINVCTYKGLSSISGYAVAGCMISGKLYLGTLT